MVPLKSNRRFKMFAYNVALQLEIWVCMKMAEKSLGDVLQLHNGKPVAVESRKSLSTLLKRKLKITSSVGIKLLLDRLTFSMVILLQKIIVEGYIINNSNC